MAYSYTPGGNTNKDKMRLLIPDKVKEEADPPAVFQDEELNQLVDLFTDVVLSAAEACDIIASDEAKRSIYFSLNTGIIVDRRRVSEFLQTRAKSLRDNALKAPYEGIDSFAYRVDEYGRDISDYGRDIPGLLKNEI